MTTTHRGGPIVLVTDARTRERGLRSRLEAATDRDVRTVEFSDDTGTVLEAALDDGGPGTEDDDATVPRFDAVVLELDRPDDVRTILRRTGERLPTVPTVVAPREGSESLAAVALRGGATEYVPTDRDEDPVDRIVETIRAPRPSDGRERILPTELPDDAFVIDEDGVCLEAAVRPESAASYSTPADELPGAELADAFPDAVAATLRDCIDRAIGTDDVQSVEYEADTTDGRRRFEARVVPIDERVRGRRAVVWLARDVTERARRERRLRARRDQLETLDRINAVGRQVIETLVEAPTREAIEREVCSRLVDSSLYCGSWIAERTGDGCLSYRTGAGGADACLEYVRDHAADEGAVGRVARTDAVRTTRVSEDETVPEPLREAARADGVRAAITVPITHEDTSYGVLTVLSSREDAFSERERDEFRLLGETIGFAIMAVKSRQLLFADAVVELEFRIDGGDTFAFDVSEEYGCACSLEWAGTTANGRIFQYVTVEGVDGNTIREAARAHDSVEQCRLVDDGTDRCTIEIRLSKSGVRTLANHGATIRDVSVEDGVGTCLIEVPRDADVREVADALSALYDETDLVARREVDRPVRTAAERRTRILDRLTDRQLTTLRLAYYGGFFEWPRESTGEEIAESMGIAPPTMHQHLRKGLETVLGAFFEDGEHTE